MDVLDRQRAFDTATEGLPPLEDRGADWIWTDAEIEMLRSAAGLRHGEKPRTETLFTIGATAIRIFKARQMKERP